jgi:FkbM family methyltransferase
MSSDKANDFNSDKRQKNFQPVQTITLDKYFVQNNITTIDMMILDFEGCEIEVLEGYRRNLNIIKYLLVEQCNFKKFNAYAETRVWKFF